MYFAIVFAMLRCFSVRLQGSYTDIIVDYVGAIYGGMVDDTLHDVHVYYGLWLAGTTVDLMVNG